MKPENMEMKYIEDNLLIERYLRGDLKKEEREAFEERFLSSPELLDQLEAAERLQEGLLDVGAVEEPGPSGTVITPRLAAITPRLAMAASVLLAVSLAVSGTLFLENRQLSEEAAQFASVPAPVQIVPLHTTRGATSAATVNTITLEQGSGQLVLMLESAMQPYHHYRAVVLRLPESEPLLELGGLQPGYQEMIALALPAHLMKPGEYRVELEGVTQDSATREPVSRLTFTIR